MRSGSGSNNFSGFAEELIKKISEKVDFDYQLYLSPDGKYGVEIEGGKINGMLGEVASKVSYF